MQSIPSDKRFVMIRFAGGSGGETFSWLLRHLLGTGMSAPFSHNKDNRMTLPDPFRLAFHSIIPPFGSYDSWDDVPRSFLSRFISDRIETSRMPIPICTGHYVSMSDGTWELFGDSYLIDIVPRHGRSWVTKSLHFRKSGLVKTSKIPNACKSHPYYDGLMRMIEKAGWIPEFYVWMMYQPGVGLDDVGELIRRQFDDSRFDGHRNSTRADYRLPGDRIVIDETLSDITGFLDSINLSLDDKAHGKLTNWVSGNLAILSEMGLDGLLDEQTDLSVDSIRGLVIDRFTLAAMEMVDEVRQLI